MRCKKVNGAMRQGLAITVFSQYANETDSSVHVTKGCPPAPILESCYAENDDAQNPSALTQMTVLVELLQGRLTSEIREMATPITRRTTSSQNNQGRLIRDECLQTLGALQTGSSPYLTEQKQ